MSSRAAGNTCTGWNRPATRSDEFRLASARASECGLMLQAAKTEACAKRNGRYWLIDRELGLRQLTARNLVEVMNFCAHRATTEETPDEHPDR